MQFDIMTFNKRIYYDDECAALTLYKCSITLHYITFWSIFRHGSEP